MKIRYFKNVGTLCTLAVSLLLVLLICTSYLNAQHQKLGDDLVVAIKRNDTRQVVLLLAQGADPNADYSPMTADEQISAMLQNTWPVRSRQINPRLSWWQHMLAQLRTKPSSHKGNISALTVALDPYLDCPSDSKLPLCDRVIVKALVDAGADVNAFGREHQTPLLLALGEGRTDLVGLLIEHNANVFSRDNYENTSLIAAGGTGDAYLVHYLLGRGVDVNAKNKYGFTALMAACYCNNKPNYDTVKDLLKAVQTLMQRIRMEIPL